VWAQTPPAPPSAEPSAPSQTPEQAPPQEPQQPPNVQQPPTIEPQQLQPLPFQQQILPIQPGQPPVTPGTAPPTRIPAWTPPVPPPPSQTNVPAPVLIPTPGVPGVAGAPIPTFPGAFTPTVATVRGATLELHPTLHVGEDYTDNFFLTSTRTEENFRSMFGPGFTLLLNGARTFGAFSTTVDLVHDTAAHSGDDVKVFPSVNAAVRYSFEPRLSLTVTDTYIRNDQASTADQFGIRRGRQIFESNSLTTAVDWLIDRFATQAYYTNTLFINEGGNNSSSAAGTGQADTLTHILGVNGSTRIATDYLARLGYEFSRTDALNGAASTDSTGHLVFGSLSRQFGLFTTGGISSSYSHQTLNNTNIFNVSLFGAYGLPTGLSVSSSVGYSLLDSDTESGASTFSTNTTVAYRFARAVISVGVFQDFRQTAQQGQNFGIVQSRSYFGSFLYQLTPFITTTLQAAYTENEPTGTGNTTGGRTETVLTAGPSVNWQILRWLVASVSYTWSKRTGSSTFEPSGSSTGDIVENRAILNLFATF
jgi:hypothetical protein